MQNRISAFFLTFSILTVLALPLSALLPSAEEAEIYESVIRLHVLACSDSKEDQAEKLAVRDEILSIVGELLADVTSRDAAEKLLEQELPLLEEAASALLRSRGSAHSVKVTLTTEEYPTRVYENVTLPSGSYTSLRVLIGKAEGKNWWCVLFPQLCVTSERVDEVMIEAGLTPSQIRLITGDSPDVVIRFRLLEWLSSLRKNK